MKIDDKTYVAIDYRLTLASGEEVDRSKEGEPLGFVTGAGQIIPGLEKALMGKTVGDRSQIVIAPEDGYGPVDESMFQELPRSQFPDDCEIEPGMTFHAQGPHGPFMLSVAQINANDTVTVDLNHPLAGQQLHFDVTVVEVREPRASELASGCGCGSSDAESCNSGNCGSGCNCG
ncbi:MAG TPA: peptidylprolyl isomerase [Desulfobulbaceae bacterium]|nr:peptidylprolyl isomerase [Desulfobulbaceae bacterium]